MTHDHDETERTTFRALLKGSGLGSNEFTGVLDTYRLDVYGDGIDGIENGDSIPCRHLEASQADSDAVGHRHLVGGDYSGGSLIRANLKAFRTLVEEETGDGPPLPIVDYFGGYGTDGVLLLLDREHDTEKLRPFVELLQALEDYPVVCDDTMSALEAEEEEEAWENHAEADFAKELAGRIGENDIAEIEGTDSVSLGELFRSVADSANLNGGPGVEHSDEGPYFYTDDAAAAVSPVLLFGFGLVKLDPDSMLELAASTDTDDHDEARRIMRLSRLGIGLRYAHEALAREIATQTAERKKAGLQEGERLTNEAYKAIEGEAKRQALEIMLRADIDAGDTSAPIGAAGLCKALRSATVKLDRFHWGGSGQASRMVETVLELDPASPYVIDREAFRIFLQD